MPKKAIFTDSSQFYKDAPETTDPNIIPKEPKTVAPVFQEAKEPEQDFQEKKKRDLRIAKFLFFVVSLGIIITIAVLLTSI